jgi:hypothetical protein
MITSNRSINVSNIAQGGRVLESRTIFCLRDYNACVFTVASSRL